MDLPDDINPGIRYTVEWLNENGFTTMDSGDGETRLYECDQQQPYVFCRCKPSEIITETRRLELLLAYRGITIENMDEKNSLPCLQVFWDAALDFAVIQLWNVKLTRS